MFAAPFDSADADKFDAAFTRRGRGGLGFTSQSTNSSTTTNNPLYATQAQRELLSTPANTSAFSASAYLQKFGWKSGTGLGKKEDGMLSYVKVSKKEDQAGLGAGVAVQAIARSFEMVFNNAARNFNVVIHDSDSDSDGEADSEGEMKEERKEERTEDMDEQENEKKKRKNDKKRKRDEEQPTAPALSPAPTPPAPTAPIAAAATVRTGIAFRSASPTTASDASTSMLSTLVVAPDSLLAFDPARSHMYHDRCRGKLARLQAQESMGQHIVDAVKRKRWEGLVATAERKETPDSIEDNSAVTQAADEAEDEEERRKKRKADKKERKRREQAAAQQAQQEESKEAPISNEAIEEEEEAERKRRKMERKEAKRRRRTQ